jgi:hypothetical protein
MRSNRHPLAAGLLAALTALAGACGAPTSTQQASVGPRPLSEGTLLEVARVLAGAVQDPAALREAHDAAQAFLYGGSDEAVPLGALLDPADAHLGPVLDGVALRTSLAPRLEALGAAVGRPDLVPALRAQGYELYWPYSAAWDGGEIPLVAVAPESETAPVIGYRLEQGTLVPAATLDEDYASTHPVLILRRDDSSLPGVEAQIFANRDQFLAAREGIVSPDKAPPRDEVLALPTRTVRTIKLLGWRETDQSYRNVLLGNSLLSKASYYMCLGNMEVLGIGQPGAINFPPNCQMFVITRSALLNPAGHTKPAFRILWTSTKHTAANAGATLLQNWGPENQVVDFYLFRQKSGVTVTTSFEATTTTEIAKTSSSTVGLNQTFTSEVKSSDGSAEKATGSIAQESVSSTSTTETWASTFRATLTVTDSDFVAASWPQNRTLTFDGAPLVWVRDGRVGEPVPTATAGFVGPFKVYTLTSQMLKAYISIEEVAY